MTWNLWWRFGDWQQRQEAIAAVLATERPDVIGLQEVWTTPNGNQAQLFAEQLGLHWVLSPSPDARRWQQRLGDPTIGIANAVLSRWPITHHANIALPAPAGRAQERTALHALIDAPGGPLPFFTTQLDSAPAESTTRRAQVTAIAHFVADSVAEEVHGHPTVLTGDLNAEPDSDEFRLLCGHKTTPVVPGSILVDAWRAAEGCLAADCWTTSDGAVVSTAQWRTESAMRASFDAATAAGVDLAFDGREARPRDIMLLAAAG